MVDLNNLKWLNKGFIIWDLRMLSLVLITDGSCSLDLNWQFLEKCKKKI